MSGDTQAKRDSEKEAAASSAETGNEAQAKEGKERGGEETSTGEEEGNSNTTQEETQVLHKILQDVEGLMQWRGEGSKKEGKYFKN